MSSSSISSNNSDNLSESADPAIGTVYPPQRHAGKVGYGPQYHLGPTFGEKVKGYEEELKGHLTHNHELVEHGKMMVSGELKRREREHDMKSNSPFEKPEKKDENHKEREEAATVSPCPHKSEKEKEGETVDNVKHIG
ncbi:hypothetical protein C0993_008783 [Termitomyces sp. T159_Od127]|nr:hypothetical protein C0993_008783 [Termitomyces sp. T159_Od127]